MQQNAFNSSRDLDADGEITPKFSWQELLGNNQITSLVNNSHAENKVHKTANKRCNRNASLKVNATSSQKHKPDFRERLLKFGAKKLTDEQLVALLLRTGYAKKSVSALAKEVMKTLDKSKITDVAENLRYIDGMGATKLCTVLAALELGRRYFSLKDSKITSPKSLVPFLLHYAVRKQETFIVASLSGANEIISIRVVSVGTLNRTLVHPREVFADPITDRAASIIIAHNHPSGNISPSEEDISLTKRLVSIGELLGIVILDHLILNERGEHFSMMESGLL